MKFKTKKIIIAILLVISLIINIISIRSTYGKYKEEIDASYEVGFRKWLIVVNGADIQNEETVMTSVVVPTLVENEHMKENIIVPGREGYFEIDVDYTKVDVPFTYSFDVEQINETKLTDLEFFGYSIIDEYSGFQIDTVTDTITYVGVEEGTANETVNTETGEKKLEFVQTLVDAETGAEKDIILTATLSLPVEETDATEGETPVESTIQTIGKVAKITRKVIDGTTGAEVEAENVIFSLEQNLDTTTNKTTYAVTQVLDPTELESYQRYQNIKAYFRWKDTEDNQMDNLADTQFRGEANPDVNVANTLLKYNATLKFKQYTQE